MSGINEASSKYVNRVKSLVKESENLLGIASQLVGAVGGNELDQMVSGALSASANLIAFANYFLMDSTVKKDSVEGNYNKVLKAANSLRNVNSSAVGEAKEISSEIFIDPYEAEYLPAEMQSTYSAPIPVKESITEDNDPLPDDLDDDPDAVITLDTDGMPVKFNNTPIDLDPFAVKLFRNNADLLDPPEIFDDTSDDFGVNSVEQPVVDKVIDAIADSDEKDEKQGVVVELPSDDFDVFANESKVLPTAVVTPKTDPVLPPQFETDPKQVNANIAEDPKNNLKMLSALMSDW